MADKKWLRTVYAVCLAMLLSISSIACLLTAFDLNASIGTVLLWCMVWSVAFGVCYGLRWQLLPLGVMAVMAGYLLQSGALYKSFGGFLYRLTDAYSLVHGWSVVGKRSSVDLVLCALGALTALFVTRAVSGRKGCWPAVILAALPLLCCAPVSDTGPDPLWLGLWLFGVGLMLTTAKLEASRLAPLIAVPLAVLSLLLMVLLPQEKQEKPREFAESVTQFLEDIGIGAAPGKALKTDGGAVSLSKLGSRKESGTLVMTVTADRTGTLYLRGCSYNTYFRNNWTNLSVHDSFHWPDQTVLESAGQVQIRTNYLMDVRYFPYYIEDMGSVSRAINNFSGAKEYSYSYGQLKERPTTYTYRPENSYTQLPTVTGRWAEQVLSELITEDMTDSQKLAAITAYVKSCAKYNLYVEKMPEDQQDFVVWFAESAGKGYCVHFATTAAVLLRGAGIPSRYVTGYMVQTQAGEPTQVYGKNAHAWVECYLEGVGWVPVEATPGAEPVALEEEQTRQQLKLEPILYISAVIFGVTALGVVTQWRVRVWQLSRKRKKGNARQQLLACYGQTAQLLALVGEAPAPALTALAEKAKFSDHPVESESLAQMEQAYKTAKKRLRKEPLLKRLHYRVILGLY